MWVKFRPVKRKEMLERILRGLPGRFDITPSNDGWVLSLWVSGR